MCPIKYRKNTLTTKVSAELKAICKEIEFRYEVAFIEIGTDGDHVHVHFVIQSMTTYSPTKVYTMVKSLIAREIFRRVPKLKKLLWGGEFWTDGYWVFTLSGGMRSSKEFLIN